jgi:hypothetical protein
MKIKGKTYKERCTDQLNKWVDGNPIHNNIDNECCPDFSCCKSELLQPRKIRETFKEVSIKADKEEFNPNYHPYDDAKMGMLSSFLAPVVSSALSGKNIHIAGQSKTELN